MEYFFLSQFSPCENDKIQLLQIACSDTLRGQVDVEIALTNQTRLPRPRHLGNAIIVPQNKMPNWLRVILFRKLPCVNRIRYESVLRDFLVALWRLYDRPELLGARAFEVAL